MIPFLYIAAALVAVVILKLAWSSRRRRPSEEGIRFVYINQDGSARELVEGKRVYLETEFEPGDSGRSYVKSSYESKNGWGSVSGFIERHRVPADIPIAGIAPTAVQKETVLMEDTIADAVAVGDLVVYGADGSVTVTPNASMSSKERFRLLTHRQLQRQKEREDAVR